ncbi:MAG: hypothetical protein KJZ75_01735 [Hyphomonadaceae bacterium]|nr:hypothetical protein [Hyphomonadaceae bacterium]GIK50017.1 MAG: hypothetical protein BroJett013_27140 [Alphaproteobacteria bacterium]
MRAAPVRFLNAAAWPLTIWSSLTHLEKHADDDYVERTSPIVATAIAFWICAAVLVAVVMLGGGFNVLSDDGVVSLAPRWARTVSGVLWFFLPVLYVVGLWLYTARDEAYRR